MITRGNASWNVCVFRVFLVHIFPYSVRLRTNTDRKNSEYGHFSRSATVQRCSEIFGKLFGKHLWRSLSLALVYAFASYFLNDTGTCAKSVKTNSKASVEEDPCCRFSVIIIHFKHNLRIALVTFWLKLKVALRTKYVMKVPPYTALNYSCYHHFHYFNQKWVTNSYLIFFVQKTFFSFSIYN